MIQFKNRTRKWRFPEISGNIGIPNIPKPLVFPLITKSCQVCCGGCPLSLWRVWLAVGLANRTWSSSYSGCKQLPPALRVPNYHEADLQYQQDPAWSSMLVRKIHVMWRNSWEISRICLAHLGTSSPFAKPNICRLQAVSCKHALKATCVCGKIWDTTPYGLIAMLIGRIWKNDQKPWGFCGTLFSGKPILHFDRTIVFSGFLWAYFTQETNSNHGF